MFSTLSRGSLLLLLITLTTWLCVAQAQIKKTSQNTENSAVSDLRLLNLTAQRKIKLHRETAEPHQASIDENPGYTFNNQPLGCGPSVASLSTPLNPHLNFSLHVYLSQDGRPTMTTGRGEYPINSVVLKEKLNPYLTYFKNTGKDPEVNPISPGNQFTTELFTGMLKREQGYNPECGDWEFFIVSGDAKKVLERGKIKSCIECHQAYKSTDYVTRAYMPTENKSE